jgi:hypothetical protein
MPRVEQGLAANVYPYPKDDAKPENEKFDPPTPGSDSRAKRPFEIHQDQHRPEKKHRIQYLAGKGEAKPGSRICLAVGKDMTQLGTKGDREQERKEASYDKRDAPFAKKRAVFSPRIGHAKAKPNAGDQRFHNEQKILPVIRLSMRSPRGDRLQSASSAKITIPTAKPARHFLLTSEGAITARPMLKERPRLSEKIKIHMIPE